ncbi:hypothetical protein HYH03_016674 [Edaphochlamys debaryana]|uniref:Uncharacterized protein n=1 Tax=Edaphochlamys debaryana TaxID=47281 RepID=A0A836BR85_9CHLO|nr:hypothetical protein HYH03_016674 [Edaphochlamys debaryana]|eukprot:KAG2484539.1 hypothetical protein HYH03_016674 [Edaphochlamys debaryana]
MGQCLGKHEKPIEEFPLECSDLQICDAFVEHLPARLQAHGLHLLSAGPGPIVQGWTHELLHESGVHSFQDREMLLKMRDRMVTAVAHHRERRRAATAAAIITSAGSGTLLAGRGSRRNSQEGASVCSAAATPDVVPSSPIASAAEIEASRVAAAAAAAAVGLGPDGKPFRLTSDWLNANVSLYRISEERSHRHLASASHGNVVHGGTTDPGCVPATAHELATMAEEAEGEAVGTEGPGGSPQLAGAEVWAAEPLEAVGTDVDPAGLGSEAVFPTVQAGLGGPHEASAGPAEGLEWAPGPTNGHVGPMAVAEAASVAAAETLRSSMGTSQAPAQLESQSCSPSPSALGSGGAWAPGPNAVSPCSPSPPDQTTGMSSCTTGDDETTSCASKSDTCSANESVLALTAPDSTPWASEPGLACRLASGLKLACPEAQAQQQTLLEQEQGRQVVVADELTQLAVA